MNMKSILSEFEKINKKFDLLTIEEALKLPKEILRCEVPKGFNGYTVDEKCCWWLRSPGYDKNAAFVNTNGFINAYGDNVYNECAIRPILRIDQSLLYSLPRTKKGYVKCAGIKWIDISSYLGEPCLLKKKCLEKTDQFDEKTNNYEQSKIKAFLENWFPLQFETFVIWRRKCRCQEKK